MSNKTFIPAFQCSVGDWKYYICMMKYGEVSRQVSFAYELGPHSELGQLIQRGISARTKGIVEYLLNSSHRFLGALVVAAWGGEPQYTQLSLDDPDGILTGLDREFGVLTFDGTQQYFAIDGQHRLRAIKDAIKQNPDLGAEDICVLIVTHYDSPEGRMRTRRLFSNINRNAKQTGAAENIALDEDDAFAVVTRRILEDHEFFGQEGRVRVILRVGAEGEVKLASGSVPKSDARAVTTFTVLYDMLRCLAWDLPSSISDRTQRPIDEVLENAHQVLSKRISELFDSCGNVRENLEKCDSARELRAPKDAEQTGHAFMRPVVQKAVARVARDLITQGAMTWNEFLAGMERQEWQLLSPPWSAVCDPDTGKMLTGKDNTVLLDQLLKVHLAPQSMQEIKRARQAFRSVRGSMYRITEDDLAKRMPSADDADHP